MHAAIKVLEDTLLIRRLQAREFSHDGTAIERVAAINGDIASLERGLKILLEANDQKSEVRGQNSGPSSVSPGSPTIGDPGQNRPEAFMTRTMGGSSFCKAIATPSRASRLKR